MTRQRGFTLIELMLVISIIGVLAAIAIPAFLGQREKAKHREGDILAADLRKDIQEFYWHTGRFPADNAEAGLPEPDHIKGEYVNSIAVVNGTIIINRRDGGYYGDNEEIHPIVHDDDPTAPLLWGDCGWDKPGMTPVGCPEKTVEGKDAG